MTGDLAIGRRASPERRLAERRAIINAHIELVLGTVRARLESGWIDQRHSPLGSQQHIDAVHRRRAAGRADACVRGQRYLLTIDAIAEEYFGSHGPRLDRALRALGCLPASNDNGGARR